MFQLSLVSLHCIIKQWILIFCTCVCCYNLVRWLKRKLPADHAMQEDLKIKKRMVELKEQTSIRNADSMQQMNANLANITSTIQDGFSLMRELMHAPPHSSSGGYGHFQEPSSPFMHRRPHRLHWPTHQEQTPLDHTRKR